MKVDELTGALLDYWVAMAGEEWKHFDVSDTMTLDPSLKGVKLATFSNGQQVAMLQPNNPFRQDPREFSPSTNWAHGGPIIQRNNISISPPTSRVHRLGGPNAGWGESGVWMATTWHRGTNGKRASAWDDQSPLVAAMRCFVSSKFGDTVPDQVAA
jgi:hypothetical protein